MQRLANSKVSGQHQPRGGDWGNNKDRSYLIRHVHLPRGPQLVVDVDCIDPPTLEPLARDAAFVRAEKEKAALLIMGGGGYRSAREMEGN